MSEQPSTTVDVGAFAQEASLSRTELTGTAPLDGTGAAMQRVVAEGSAYDLWLVAPSDLRQIELWRSPEGLVAHGYHRDPDVATTTSWWTDVAAPYALASLCRVDDAATPASSGQPEASTASELIRQVLAGDLGPDARLAVLGRAGTDEPDLVRLHVGGATWWSRVADGGSVALTDGDYLGLATAFATVVAAPVA